MGGGGGRQNGASGAAVLESRDDADFVTFRLALAAASVAPRLPKEVPAGARSVPDCLRPGILRGAELLVVAGRFRQVSGFLCLLDVLERNNRSGKAKEEGEISMVTLA